MNCSMACHVRSSQATLIVTYLVKMTCSTYLWRHHFVKKNSPELTRINGITKPTNVALRENTDEAGPNKGIDVNKPYKQLKRFAFNKRFHKW